jgi:hypothetical protein
MPSMTTKPVVVPMTAVVEHFRSAAISSMPGVNMDETSGLRTTQARQLVHCGGPQYVLDIKAITPTLAILRHFCQLRGFSSG